MGGYSLFVRVTHPQGQSSGRGSHCMCLSSPLPLTPYVTPKDMPLRCSVQGRLPGPARVPPLVLVSAAALPHRHGNSEKTRPLTGDAASPSRPAGSGMGQPCQARPLCSERGSRVHFLSIVTKIYPGGKAAEIRTLLNMTSPQSHKNGLPRAEKMRTESDSLNQQLQRGQKEMESALHVWQREENGETQHSVLLQVNNLSKMWLFSTHCTSV
uniref:apoptosis regulator Bcl-2 isoform X3 n=1 Tax=Halichoerus grypus TaxID=9711 RepID=UPI001659E8AF|nr:apoptosis regulator Bcl-2 isoform X3 [Halichoerus grypus]